MNSKTITRFENLDGFRAIACIAVIISHIELYKKSHQTNSVSWFNFDELGGIGVTLFFVLSGFLITSLLLKEKEENQKINYRFFYFRRILRIWPLYFLVLFFGCFIYPKFSDPNAFWYSIFLLPNIAFIKHLLPFIIDPIWSIGIEEQYYLFQPHLFRIKKLRITFFITLALIFLFWLLKIILPFISVNTFPQVNLLRDWLYFARFDNMLIGSLFAMLFYNETSKKFISLYSLNFIYKKQIQFLTYITFINYLFIVFIFKVHVLHQVVALMSAVMILNLINPKTSILSLNNKVLNYLGKISYGLYLLHMLPLTAIIYFSEKNFSNSNPILINVGIYISTFFFSIILASLSYFYFEKYFLKLKSKFEN